MLKLVEPSLLRIRTSGGIELFSPADILLYVVDVDDISLGA